jgi:hypothetical protein
MRVFIILLAFASVAWGQASQPLRLEKTIELPDVQGRIDHMSVDVKGGRLFVSALGNNTVEVVDVKAGKRVKTIEGLRSLLSIGCTLQIRRMEAFGYSMEVHIALSRSLITAMTPTIFGTILITSEYTLAMAAALWQKSMMKATRLARSSSTPIQNHSSLRKTVPRFM